MDNNALNTKHRISRKQRRRARAFAVQAVYQYAFNRQDLAELKQQFRVNNAKTKIEWDFFDDLLGGVMAMLSELDELIAPALSRDLADVNSIDLAILRVGAYELKCRLDVPYKVAINEYIDLAWQYGAADEAYRFINGVLNKLAKALRPVEYGA